jgi:death-on-curing protein
MDTMLLLNGAELQAPVEEAETIILGVASGQVSREQLVAWVDSHTVPATS